MITPTDPAAYAWPPLAIVTNLGPAGPGIVTTLAALASVATFDRPTAPPRRRLRVGAWNLKVARDPDTVQAEVQHLLTAEDLDVLAVHEARPYAAHLARIPGYDYLVTRGRGPGPADAGLLVRHGLRVRGRRLVRTRTGWDRVKHPGRHWPRSFPSVIVEGVRLVSVHMPDTRAPARSELAYAECVVRLLGHLGRRNAKPWVALGDWNKRPGLVGAFTPRALANALRARITGTTIDHLVSRHLEIRDYRRGPKRGSDHAPVLCTLVRAA